MKNRTTILLTISSCLAFSLAAPLASPWRSASADFVLDSIEQAGEAAAEQAAETAEAAAEQVAEAAAEQAAEQAAETAAEQAVEAAEEQAAEAATEQAAESAAEQAAETAVEQSAEAATEQAAEAASEQAAEAAAEQLTDTAVDQIAESAAEQASEIVANQASEIAGETAAEAALDRAGDIENAQAEELAAQQIEERAAENAVNGFETAVQNTESSSVILPDNDGPPDEADGGGAYREDRADAGRASARVNRAVLNFDTDDNGNSYVSREAVLLVDDGTSEGQFEQGTDILEVKNLAGLGLTIARARLSDEAFGSSRQQAVVGGKGQAIDRNHLFGPESAPKKSVSRSYLSPDQSAYSSHKLHSDIAVGMIDTDIALDHEVFSAAAIEKKEFVSHNLPQPKDHGTAVASILVGNSDQYGGLLTTTKLYAASVFMETPDGDSVATVYDLVVALDWMVVNKVAVVNMSFSGPANDVLEKVVGIARKKGTFVVPAVGNGGPSAPVQYPSGYSDTIAATAIDRRLKVYRLANRGNHVQFAAPGVDVVVAKPGGSYSRVSGTSFASPYVTAVLAHQFSSSGSEPREVVVQELTKHSRDLGSKGHDPVYGYGLIQPLTRSITN